MISKKFFRTQIEFLSNPDADGFIRCWVAGIREDNLPIIINISDIAEYIDCVVGKIVHSQCNFDLKNLQFKDWENE